MKLIERNIRLMVSHGMKMTNLRKVLSWISRLQFDIDRTIKQSKDWDDFIKRMATFDYEIKYGKHVAFKHKDKERFTRVKTIGEDYTEFRLKERILDNANQRTYTVKNM